MLSGMPIDLSAVFLNNLDLRFSLEIIFRTVLMFGAILAFLRLSGKKGVRQLSIFEVAIIIALGSAAGDPMFNEDVAIVPAMLVFASILLFYRTVTWLASRSERFESLLEGDPVYVIEDGEFVTSEEGETTYAQDEFFSEMRQQSIEHVGQIRAGILETSGSMSFFYFDDDQVKLGLPILPKPYQLRSKTLAEADDFACTGCGRVTYIETARHVCKRCGKEEWVKALNSIRRS